MDLLWLKSEAAVGEKGPDRPLNMAPSSVPSAYPKAPLRNPGITGEIVFKTTSLPDHLNPLSVKVLQQEV